MLLGILVNTWGYCFKYFWVLLLILEGIVAPGYTCQITRVLFSVPRSIVVNIPNYCCQYPTVLLSIPQSIVVNTPKYSCQYSKVLLSILQSIVVNTPKYCCQYPKVLLSMPRVYGRRYAKAEVCNCLSVRRPVSAAIATCSQKWSPTQNKSMDSRYGRAALGWASGRPANMLAGRAGPGFTYRAGHVGGTGRA